MKTYSPHPALLLALPLALAACGGGGGGGGPHPAGTAPPVSAPAPEPAGPFSAAGLFSPTEPSSATGSSSATEPSSPTGATSPVGPTVIANTTSTVRDIAVSDSGVRAAAWSDGTNVYAQRFDAAGNLLGDRLQVAAQAAFTGVAPLASGGWVIEYQRPGAVFAQVLTAAGAVAGGPITVRTQAQIAADFPPDPLYPAEAASLAGASGVIAFADGSFAAAYLKYQPSHIPGTIPYALFAQKYDAAGHPVGAPALLRSVGSATSFTMAPAPGTLLVADILACPCSGSGAPGTQVFDANLESAHVAYGGMPGNNSAPSAAALPGGNFVMTWSAGSTVQGQVFTADPAAVTGSRNVTPVLTFPNAAPGARVLALAGGGFLLAWAGGAQAFDAAGQAVSPVMQILEGSVAATPDGGFVVLAQVGAQLVEQQYSVGR